MEFSKSF
jgi:hypothetical protein